MNRELDIARQLVRAGIPVFVAYPDPLKPGDFKPSPEWQKTKVTQDFIGAWKPGLALCAVMGQGLDLIDVDPRNDGTIQSLNAMMPKAYAVAATPSGGEHYLVKSLGLHSRDNIFPGIDYKGGAPDGQGRGFGFIDPTVRVSKTTGEMVAYEWIEEPNFDGIEDDDSGTKLAEHIRGLRERPGSSERVDYEEILAGVPEGQRDRKLFEFACSLRAKSIPRQYAEQMVLDAAANCSPPFDRDEALAKVASAWKYEPTRGGFTTWGGDRTKNEGEQPATGAVTMDDFRAYLPAHQYLFIPTRELWPAASVNSRLGPVIRGDNSVTAASWLDTNRPIEQMTWSPGEEMIVRGRLLDQGGWIRRDGVSTFNLYRGPVIEHGDPAEAEKWIEHVHLVYPNEADHIIDWLAHRVQKPNEKVNHGVVLGGEQGIGKDTLLEPVKHAVGPWNFTEVSPAHLVGRFNGFVNTVVLRISEARDLGDVDRYAFYEHSKVYLASPPDVLRVDEKHLREIAVPNVCGVIITTNHKTNGIFLPPDDRRHFVAWSERTITDFSPSYWNEIYGWYAAGGLGHVAAYLASRDISQFDAKAPPLKTAAFWDIADANRAPEDDELVECLDWLSNPAAVTISQIIRKAEHDADGTFHLWLKDRRNTRLIPHRFESVGYVAVRNDAQADGRWKVGGKNVVIYSKKELSLRDRIAAARKLAGQ